MFKFDDKTALLVIDTQLDFMPGGALPVTDGDKIVPYINSVIKEMKEAGGIVVMSADWHPSNHSSFKEHGGTWPSHCNQFSEGAKFHPDLIVDGPIFFKGYDPAVDSYSAFGGKKFDGNKIVDLGQHLIDNGIQKVVVVGLALDFCIKATAIDARKEGFLTLVDLQGTKAVFPEKQQETINELVDNFVWVLE